MKTFARKGLDDQDFTKVVVPLGENPWHGFTEEAMWARRVDEDLFELQNTPFLATGLSFLDRVRTRASEDGRLLVAETVTPSRHSTYRAILAKPIDSDALAGLLVQLNLLGCTYEAHMTADWTLLAFDVVPSTVDAAYELFQRGEKEGLWEFEEGHFGGRDQ